MPVPSTTITLAFPFAEKVILPFTTGIFTLLLPFATAATAPATMPVNRLPLPTKYAPLTLPVVFILPLPVSNVPAMLTPVPVTTTILALPTALIVILPFAVLMFTLLFPLAIDAPPPPPPPAAQLKLPAPSVVSTYPPVPPSMCTLLTLPNETFDAVEKLALADILIELALSRLAPVKSPPDPAPNVTVPEILALPADTLPADTLPVILAYPVILAPVPVTTTMFALPTALNVMLPFAVAIFTLLFPLLMLDGLPVAFHDSDPAPSVVNTYPAVPPVICTLLTLPNETFDAVEKLALADMLIELALSKLAPVKSPPDPAPNVTVPVILAFPTLILLALTLPVILAYPVILAPRSVIVNVVLPLDVVVTFPFAVAIFTLLVPLLMLAPLEIPVN